MQIDMTVDFTRRRFLFGLAAAPLVIPAVKHFVMPKFTLEAEQKHKLTAQKWWTITATAFYGGDTWIATADECAVITGSHGFNVGDRILVTA